MNFGQGTARAGHHWRRWFAGVVGAGALALSVYLAVPASAAASQWLAVSAGGYHTCGIKADHSLWCWGANTYGQLGIANNVNKSVPTRVGTATNWNSVTSGRFHTCALTTTGTRNCWGLNNNGQLGLGDTNNRSTPGFRTGEGAWSQLSAGDLHTCGRQSNNNAQCWGANTYGALGTGDGSNQTVPTNVAAGGQLWTSISAGGLHTCGVTSGGVRACWGANEAFQLGLNNRTQAMAPTSLPGDMTGYFALEAGGSTTCALMTDSRLFCWGTNEYGHAGLGNTTVKSTPVRVTQGTYTKVNSGGYHACAIATGGTLYCWGRNEGGALGLGDGTTRLAPTQVTGMPTGVASVSAGMAHTCAIRATDSTLYCWGYNYNGQVGNASTANRLTPVQII